MTVQGVVIDHSLQQNKAKETTSLKLQLEGEGGTDRFAFYPVNHFALSIDQEPAVNDL